MYTSVIIYLAALVVFSNRTDALDCYHCSGIKSPAECHSLIVCPGDHQCYITEEKTAKGSTYTLGCIPTMTCVQASVSIVVIGRRLSRPLSRDARMTSLMTSRRDAGCSVCCDRDACNKHACDGELAPTTIKTPSPPPTPTPFEFHTAAPEECRDDIAWCRTMLNVCQYSTRHECRKFCNLCSDTTNAPTSSAITTSVQTPDPDLGQWNAWGTWSCAHLSGICFMVRHRHCSSFSDDCPGFSYMITTTCLTSVCGTVTAEPLGHSYLRQPTTPAPPSGVQYDCDTSGGYRKLQLDGFTNPGTDQPGTSQTLVACIRVHLKESTWSNSRVTCQSEGGDLVTPETRVKTLLLRENVINLQNNGTDYWIGAKYSHSRQQYVWEPSNVALNGGDWSSAHAGAMTSSMTSQDCIAMLERENYQWNDVNCGTRLGFICERPLYPVSSLIT